MGLVLEILFRVICFSICIFTFLGVLVLNSALLLGPFSNFLDSYVIFYMDSGQKTILYLIFSAFIIGQLSEKLNN